MFAIAFSIYSLLIGTALLLLGLGLLGTLLALRANFEGFSPAVIGYVMSSYFVGFVLGPYICRPLIQNFGHIRTYAALTATVAALAMCHVLFVGAAQWAVFRVITGICMVGFYMIIESWLNVLAPNHLRGAFLSAYMTITLLALAASQYLLLAGNVADFTLFAYASVLISMAVVPIVLTRIAQPDLGDVPELHLINVSKQSPVGAAGTLTAGIVMGAFWSMMAVYCKQIGFDKEGIATLLFVTIMGGAILQWPIGRLSDSLDRRKVLALTACLAAVFSIVGFLYGSSASPLLYVVYFLFGGVAFSLYSLSVAHVNDHLKPEETLDASQNLLQIYGIGAIVGPVVAGITMHYFGPRTLPLLFALALLILCLFIVYRVRLYKGPAVEDQETFIPVLRTSPVSVDMDPRTDLETEPVTSQAD